MADKLLTLQKNTSREKPNARRQHLRFRSVVALFAFQNRQTATLRNKPQHKTPDATSETADLKCEQGYNTALRSKVNVPNVADKLLTLQKNTSREKPNARKQHLRFCSVVALFAFQNRQTATLRNKSRLKTPDATSETADLKCEQGYNITRDPVQRSQRGRQAAHATEEHIQGKNPTLRKQHLRFRSVVVHLPR